MSAPELREELNYALNGVIHLERGLALSNAPITDPDQLQELMRVKQHVLKALELESEVRKSGQGRLKL